MYSNIQNQSPIENSKQNHLFDMKKRQRGISIATECVLYLTVAVFTSP